MVQLSECPLDKKQRITADIDYKSHIGTKSNFDVSNLNTIIAPFDLIVKGIYPPSNTIFYESIEPVKAPHFTDFECGLLTHADKLRSIIKIGAVIKKGTPFYDPGTKLNGKLNQVTKHTHMGMGRGKLLKKDKATGGYWFNTGNGNYAISCTEGPLLPEEAYFVPDNLPIDRELESYKHNWIRSSGAQEEEKMEELNYGQQVYIYKDKRYSIVLQPKETEPYIISNEHPKLLPLTKIDVGPWMIYSKQNLSVFEFVQGNPNYGNVYGSELSDKYDEAVPESQGFIDVVRLLDGTWKFGNFGPYQYRRDEATLRFSTYMVLVAGGVYSNEKSKISISTANTRMNCIFVNWNNEALQVVSLGSATVDEMRDLALHLGMQYAFVNDSGGSTETVYNGKIITENSSERPLPNCFAFVRKSDLPHNQKTVDPPTPPIEPPAEDKDKIIADLTRENTQLSKDIENANNLADSINKQLVDEIKANDVLSQKIKEAVEVLTHE
ncbi:MAG: hypothetical protein RR565_09625 [Erysipelothrix sp.]